MEHSDDVSDVDAKNTDFEPQNSPFRTTDFYIFFTAQNMLKVCPLLEHGLNYRIKLLMYCLELRINFDWAY